MHPTHLRLFGENGWPAEFAPKTNEPIAEFTLSAVDYIEVNGEERITRLLPLFSSNELPRVVADIHRCKAESAAPKKVEPDS
jgi:hypothetical protein